MTDGPLNDRSKFVANIFTYEKNKITYIYIYRPEMICWEITVEVVVCRPDLALLSFMR